MVLRFLHRCGSTCIFTLWRLRKPNGCMMADPRRSLPCFPRRSTSLSRPLLGSISPPSTHRDNISCHSWGGGGVLVWAFVGSFFAEQCVVLRKTPRTSIILKKLIVLTAVPGGNGEGGWGLTSKDQKKQHCYGQVAATSQLSLW